MGYSQRIDRFSKTIDQDDSERRIQTSFKLKESVVVSLDSIAKAVGVTKTHLLNNLLEIGLTELCEALEANRPDLIEDVVQDAQAVYPFVTPGHVRSVRERFGNALQIDIEDAIREEEEKKQCHGS